MMEEEEVEHDEASYSSYDEQVTVQSPGTWVTEDLTSSTLEQYHHRSLDTHVVIKNLESFQPIGIDTSPSQVFNSLEYGYDLLDSLATNEKYTNTKTVIEAKIEGGEFPDIPLGQTNFPAIHLENARTDLDWKRHKADRLMNEAIIMPNTAEVRQKLSEETIHNEKETDLEKDNVTIGFNKKDKLRATDRDHDAVELGKFDKKEILRATNRENNAIGKVDKKNGLKASEQDNNALSLGKTHTDDSLDENNETILEIRIETGRYLDPGDYLLQETSQFPRDGGLDITTI